MPCFIFQPENVASLAFHYDSNESVDRYGSETPKLYSLDPAILSIRIFWVKGNYQMKNN